MHLRSSIPKSSPVILHLYYLSFTMPSVKEYQNSLIDMIPFTCILFAQMLLFASLSSAQKLTEKFMGNDKYKEFPLS